MPVARFLRDHWQKRPLLVRGAFPKWKDPLTPEELAGLACEDDVESRIVREKGGRVPWEVFYGPHSEQRFRKMPARGWTFLVQEANRHVPDLARLLDRFSFIPNVRVDDVMVSYAAPGGSVGAHLDSYDVFLVQGSGKRRWKWGNAPPKDASFVADLELRILRKFFPDEDEVLEAGDMLYLPPGVAHHGIAKTSCLTYSVGFRAPSHGEMVADFARSSFAVAAPAALLGDPALLPDQNPGAIPKAMLARVRAVVRAVDTSDAAIDRWFATFATRLRPGSSPSAPAHALTQKAIVDRLARGIVVERSEEGRFAFLPRLRGELLLYYGGQEIRVPALAAPLARAICSRRVLPASEIVSLSRPRAAKALLVELFAKGALRFGNRRRED